MDNALYGRTSTLKGHMSIVTLPSYEVGMLIQRDVKSFDDDDDDQSGTLSPQFKLLCVALCKGRQNHTQGMY